MMDTNQCGNTQSVSMSVHKTIPTNLHSESPMNVSKVMMAAVAFRGIMIPTSQIYSANHQNHTWVSVFQHDSVQSESNCNNKMRW